MLVRVLSSTRYLCYPCPQVFLEWSKEKYAAQFSIYADNLAGKSYER